ncbi:hypothetical protein [Brunnivagina elsteri]|uniref:hypothetical protein n=1 Tax=Brunnivagina elsteri TaxID=1247191 RepID=UPI001177B238|nr:hypothetical protein [Calothrix elsteri]
MTTQDHLFCGLLLSSAYRFLDLLGIALAKLSVGIAFWDLMRMRSRLVFGEVRSCLVCGDVRYAFGIKLRLSRLGFLGSVRSRCHEVRLNGDRHN